MSKILVVVDMQNDFIDGVLGTESAREILPRAVERIKSAKEEGYDVVLTMDTHDANYLETSEGRSVPVTHCIDGEVGWRLNADVAAVTQGCKVFKKSTFASVSLVSYLKEANPEEVEVIGVCTDICVIYNALLIKTVLPETPVVVNSSCCAGSSAEGNMFALKAMKNAFIEVK